MTHKQRKTIPKVLEPLYMPDHLLARLMRADADVLQAKATHREVWTDIRRELNLGTGEYHASFADGRVWKGDG